MNAPDIIKIATSIIQRLFDEGHTAFFAGGWVRDLLLGLPSDEIDIATSAPPDHIVSLFPKTIPVGIAFGVVIVVEEGVNFEITTFRKDHPYHDGRHPDGVDFSTPEKDAQRRDFTINGMFYDPLTKTLYDFVGGEQDLKRGIIRAIGNPEERFTEDRLRMLRAVRFSTRFEFSLDPATKQAITAHAHTLLPAVSHERIWQELTKMSLSNRFDQAILMLHELHLLEVIFPDLTNISDAELRKKVSFFPYFPIECPLIVYLLELFSDKGIDFLHGLCHFFKTSTADMKLVDFFIKSKALFAASAQPVEWAHFYAHPHASLFLTTSAAKILPPKKQHFLKEHQHRQQILSPHINRIITHHPLVTSAHLLQEGIPPSKKMGSLLREAERIAINQDLHSAEQVLNILKASTLWENTN